MSTSSFPIRSEQTGHAFIALDKCLDYIPFISIINNVIDLTAKIALSILSQAMPSTYRSIQDHSLVLYLQNKNALTCVLLTIPFFNVFVALNHHTIPTSDSRHAQFPLKDSPLNDHHFFQPKNSFNSRIEEMVKQSKRSADEILRESRERQVQARQDFEETKRKRMEESEKSLKRLREIIESHPEGSEKRRQSEELYQQFLSTMHAREECLEEITKAMGILR